MIFIKKPAAPGFLTDPEKKWFKETQKAIEHYEGGANTAFEFDSYNDSKLKDELKKVFPKCAYCETVYGAGYDGDVEHFRPKGRVNEKNPPTPGYYWLANDWDNLLLSCQHCNQKRKHILYGDDKLKGYGKLDQFPLDSEAKRATRNSPIKDEEEVRLLVNPCIDKPEQHFAYEKTEGVIVPLTKRGTTSVEVYVLRRPILVQERKKIMVKLFKQMKLVRSLLIQMNADTNNEEKAENFETAFGILLDYTAFDAPYSGMCLFFVNEFLRENNLEEIK